jgi:hypothetical protein
METLSVKAINRDTSRFQFRSQDFSEDRVQWLVENWSAAAVDPLDVWRTDEGDFLLSGHHRHETMIRLRIQECVCRVHTFSLEEAQTFALKSNATRLQYSDFEYSRCIAFLVDRGSSISEAANEMAISPGMAKKYYSLRHLVGTDWEMQAQALDLSARAFEIGQFCENTKLSRTDLQALFKVVVDNELNAPQVRQLLRDIKRQREVVAQTGTLFDIGDFSSKAVRAVKERNFLDAAAAESWWLYCLLNKNSAGHEFPPDLKEDFLRELKRFYAYCIGSDDTEAEPTRATSKGRKLRVSVDGKKAS